AASIPPNDLARIVADGLEASEKPTKHSIAATKTPFELSARAQRHHLGPLFGQLRKVVGVNGRSPTQPARLVLRDTRIVLPTLIHKPVRAIRQFAPGDRRKGENRSPLCRVGILVVGIRRGHERRPLSLRLRSRCSRRLATGTSSKRASRRWTSAHAGRPSSRRTRPCACVQSARRSATTPLPFP